jgi:hypothetical protein
MFNQRVRRALDRPFDAAFAQQPADERRLPRAELTSERDDHSAVKAWRDAGAACFGGSGIRQVQRQRRHVERSRA